MVNALRSLGLGAQVVCWPSDRGPMWWSPRVGRGIPARSEAEGPARDGERARWARFDLVEGPPPDVARWIPVRSALPLLRIQSGVLWHPDPLRPDAGGCAWRARPLSPAELALWRSVDGKTSGAGVAARAGESLEALEVFWRWACAPEVQAGQWRDAPVSDRDPSRAQLFAAPRPPFPRADGLAERGATDLTAWHLGLTRVDRHFDDVETTVAHALSEPHPGLQGRVYGAALADALAGWPAGLLVEVGCGTGAVAAALSPRRPGPYLRVDLSPALCAAQARAAPSTWGVVADGVALPLRDGCASVLVSNEVIADLAAVRVDGDPPPALAAAAARAGMTLQAGATYNLGAWQLVAEVARVLAPGGRACITEFGSESGDCEEAVQLDHAEVSIRFGDLVRVAAACGLRAQLVPLEQLLGADLGALQLDRTSYAGLRALCASQGRHLPARAYTPALLAAAVGEPVEGVRWVPLSAPGPGPLITRFLALLLEKPAGS